MYADFVVSCLRHGTAAPLLRKVALAATFVVALTSAQAANAQFSSLSLPTLTESSSGASGATISGKAGKSGIFSFGLYPYAPFQFDANIKDFKFNTNNSGSSLSSQSTISGFSAKFTANGVLLAPEYVYTLPNHKSGVGVGGWYWLHTQEVGEGYSGNFDADLYDLHIKYFFTPKLGLEVGYLGQTNFSIPPQEGANAYVSYAIDSNKGARKGGFGATIGLGVQNIEKFTLNEVDAATSVTTTSSFDFKQTTDLGAYVTGSYYVIPHGSINLSYWLLSGSQKVDITGGSVSSSNSVSGSGSTSQSRTVARFAVGFGYQF